VVAGAEGGEPPPPPVFSRSGAEEQREKVACHVRRVGEEGSAKSESLAREQLIEK
jgi:hypothetical protein